MRATIKSVNYSAVNDWLFLLEDSHHNTFYIVSDSVYKANNLTSPVDRQFLDRADKGMSVVFESITIGSINIVTKIFSHA